MVYEFKSRATGSVTMTGAVGERILGVIGKAPDAKGIIPVDRIPDAIAALQAAIALEKAGQAGPAGGHGDGGGNAAARADADDAEQEDDDRASATVSLGQRAFPLIELLERAHAAGKDVTWGV